MKPTRSTPTLQRALLALTFALAAPSALLAAESNPDAHAAHHPESTQATSATQSGQGRPQGMLQSGATKPSVPMDDGLQMKDGKGMMGGMDHGSKADGQNGMGMQGQGMHGSEAGHGPMMDMGKSQPNPSNPGQ